MSDSPPENDNQVLQAFLEVMNDEADLSLKMDGSVDLPNLSSIVSIDDDEWQVLIRMHRPLPNHLSNGTRFEASLEALGQLWKAWLLFKGRAGHLHYVFDLPMTMEKLEKEKKNRPRTLKRIASQSNTKTKSASQDDPELEDNVVKAFCELLESGEEFTLDIDGSRGLPHSPYVLSLDHEAMKVVLKMHRPFPYQLREGTICRASIGALGKFWKAKLLFRGRIDYLQYLFDLPLTLEKAGRREHKRYPFRPRENIQVHVQDSGLKCFGADGPLIDLSAGGMVFRADRAFRLEDRAILRMDTAMFFKGKSFPLIRISGLRGVAGAIKLRGEVAHVTQRGSAIYVAFAFGSMDTRVEETLAQLLGSRKKKRLRFLFQMYISRQF